MKQLGLTGSIASGKSTVSRLLEANGFSIVNLDELGREILDKDPEVAKEVRALFGDNAFGPSGSVDRLYLRARVFSIPEERKKLESILHPRIWNAYHARLKELERKGITRVICEAALLVESQNYKLLDGGLIVVTAPDDVRVKRLMQRDGITEALARQMLASQLPQSEKIRSATYIVENGGTLEELEAKVTKLLAKLA